MYRSRNQKRAEPLTTGGRRDPLSSRRPVVHWWLRPISSSLCGGVEKASQHACRGESDGIRVSGPTKVYARGKRNLGFHFCPDCGCVAYWRGLALDEKGRRRSAVNLRLAEPGAVACINLRPLRWTGSSEDLPRDGRCVADMWFYSRTLLSHHRSFSAS
jgi:hypothetical protein